MFALEPFPTDNLVADREQYTHAQVFTFFLQTNKFDKLKEALRLFIC